MKKRSFVEEKGGFIIVRLTGAIIGSNSEEVTAEALRNVIAEYADERKGSKGPQLIIDLSKTTYLNATGIGMLVQAHANMKRHEGKMIVVGIHPGIANIFRITKLDTVFTICESLEDGIKQLAQ